jgi:hypothetical protein
VSSATYHTIELSLSLPENPVQFIAAIQECFALSESEVSALLAQYAVEYVTAELGEGIAQKLVNSGKFRPLPSPYLP